MSECPDNSALPAAADPAASASSEIVHNLLRLLQIARYRRKTIVRCLCAAAIAGAAYYAFAPRYYDAAAKLLLITRNLDQMASMADQPNQDNTMATQREIITSPIVLQEAIEQLPPEHLVDFHDHAPAEWRRVLASRLTARTTRKTNLVEVRYRSLSPEAASAVVSAVIQSYLEFIDRTHRGSATDAIAVLTRERAQLTQTLEQKQQELQAFRRRVGHLAVESGEGLVDPVIQRALKLSDALLEAQQRRLTLQASHAALADAIAKGGDLQEHLIGLEESLGRQLLVSVLGLSPQDLSLLTEQEQKLLEARTELQNDLAFYGPAHPRIADLTARVRTIEQYLANYRAGADERLASIGGANLGPLLNRMLQQSIAQAQQQEFQLQASFDEARAEAAQHSGDLVQLSMLEREVARLESLHDVLFNKIANVDFHQLQPPIQATVVAEPLPPDVPSSPQLRLIAAIVLLLGLGIGGLVAYVQDVLDDRFASPDEMMAQLGAPMLAIVRRLDALAGAGLATIHTHAAPNAPQTEAFRTLRTALTLSAGATGRIAVSSAEPGDGKTTVAANLAVSFAQAGKRTLIIDADLRKPGMTTLLGLKGRTGIADLLYGSQDPGGDAANCVQHTDLPGLDVLPAGLRRPNPAELLSSTRLVELLAWAESIYDQVLVDCPPVLAVSDAQIVGRLVDGAILVVQPQKNHRRLVTRACESFRVTGTTVLGIVANGLAHDDGRGYGYGYGYDYGYGYGYGADSAGESADAAREEQTEQTEPIVWFHRAPRQRPSIEESDLRNAAA
jgi:capsular exopolysaccharide synthesis family protein